MSSAVPTPPTTPNTAYRGNSKVASNEPETAATSDVPKLKKIEGVVKVKKPLGKRIAESFGGQDLKTVGKTLAVTVLLPGAKDIMMSLLEEGGRKIIYGDDARRGSTAGRLRQTSYGAASRGATVITSAVRDSREAAITPREKSQFDFSGLLIEDPTVADRIIMEMESAIEEFGLVTVADFFEAIEVSGNGYTDRQFGWDAKAFAGAEPKRVRGGWILDLPEPLPIKA